MKRRIRFVLTCLATLGLSSEATAQRAPDGKVLYLAKCSTCHGRAGKAAPLYAKKGAVDLNDPDWQKERSDAYIKETLAKGSPGTAMRSFKDELNAEQIDAVVKFVRTLNTALAK
jgi:mono/diheme cytochrome c family protein